MPRPPFKPTREQQEHLNLLDKLAERRRKCLRDYRLAIKGARDLGIPYVEIGEVVERNPAAIYRMVEQVRKYGPDGWDKD